MLKPFKGTAVGIIDHSRSTANRPFTLNKDYHAAVFLLFWACLPFFEVYIYNLIFILRCCYPIFFLIIRPFLDVLLFSLHFFVISAFFRCRHWSKRFTQIQGCGITMPVTRWVHFSFYKKKEKILRWVCAVHFILLFFSFDFRYVNSLFTVVLVHLSKAPIFCL